MSGCRHHYITCHRADSLSIVSMIRGETFLMLLFWQTELNSSELNYSEIIAGVSRYLQ